MGSIPASRANPGLRQPLLHMWSPAINSDIAQELPDFPLKQELPDVLQVESVVRGG